jgi:hypothetical protein
MAQGRCADPKAEAARVEKIRRARSGTRHSEETKNKIAAMAQWSQTARRLREGVSRGF